MFESGYFERWNSIFDLRREIVMFVFLCMKNTTIKMKEFSKKLTYVKFD